MRQLLRDSIARVQVCLTHGVVGMDAALTSTHGQERLLHRHADALAGCAGEMLFIKPLEGGQGFELLQDGLQ